MSLKAFHVFFVTVATLGALAFGVWALRGWSGSGDGSLLFYGVASLAMAAGLVVYGRWFLRKTTDMGYL